MVASLLGAVLLCLGMLSASVESLAREIPSLFLKEVVIQLLNHTANAFCGSKVLVIILKTNTFSEKVCLLELVSSQQTSPEAHGSFSRELFLFPGREEQDEEDRVRRKREVGKGRSRGWVLAAH